MKYYLLRSMVEEKEYQEEGYGVLLIDDDMSRRYICNVTQDYGKMRELVDNMNEFSVEPCHTENIIEDFKYCEEIGECTWYSSAFFYEKFNKRLDKYPVFTYNV